MSELTAYEREQLQAVEDWKNKEPSVVKHAVGKIADPLVWLVLKVVSAKAIEGVLAFANTAGRWLAETDDILRGAGVESVAELRTKSLEVSDTAANRVHNWAIGIATAEGAATGAFGIFGAPVDLPAIITLAMQTIHEIGICYGYECKDERDQEFVRGILAASGANTMDEKLAALAMLQALRMVLARQTFKGMSVKAAEQILSKEAAIIAVRNLAKQLGINITKRRALAAIPVIGAAIGGSVNGWYIREVGWAARRAFQERWLLDKGKLVIVEPSGEQPRGRRAQS